MAGHSKWANIKHRKGAQDAMRSKIFLKLSREIMVAASKGMDPDTNPTLRLAIAKARAKSMPKKNIENAINKADKSGASGKKFEELSFGGNVGKVSFIVNCLTDSINRTTSNIKSYFSKHNGSISSLSSVSYIFDKKGVLEIEKSKVTLSSDEMMLIVIEAGADDFLAEEDLYFIYTHATKLHDVKIHLEKNNITDFRTDEIVFIPNMEIKLTKDKAEKILAFIEILENDDDITNVYHNLDSDSLI